MTSTIIPCLRYRDAPRMIEWLCQAFGFERHLVVEDGKGGIAHAQLTLGREQYEQFGIEAFLAQCDAKLAKAGVVLPVRDQAQWFLAGFWAAPDLRLQGIGGPLLREVFEEGRRRRATSFYVWASVDEAALAAYMKLGMLPGTQLITFTGRPRGLPGVRSGSTTDEFTYPDIAALERQVVGASREVDDAYWRERGFAARRGGTIVRRGRPCHGGLFRGTRV